MQCNKQTCISNYNSLRDFKKQKYFEFISKKGRRITKDYLKSKPFLAKATSSPLTPNLSKGIRFEKQLDSLNYKQKERN